MAPFRSCLGIGLNLIIWGETSLCALSSYGKQAGVGSGCLCETVVGNQEMITAFNSFVV